ncbi:protein DROOPING LEAF isoform X1 [Typha latifolia]|uniref:protein DROOPING LEAF isoform X1 n=1 Tax=Typha latifolia TaxID=4733 RepID=UPI003C2C1E34
MDLVSPSEHLCYVRCTYCNTVLALQVGVPCKRLMDTVTVKCGHCNNLSFLSPRPMLQALCPTDHQNDQMGFQGPCNDCRRIQPSPPFSVSLNEEGTPKQPFVVKPPEKKHRLPSAYNRFMKEEIQRIKAAKPDIPHREAFSMAAKNWAKCDPRCSSTVSSSDNTAIRSLSLPHERGNALRVEGFDVFKQMERKD